jgi:carboxymethylenebutenolidase
LGQQFTLTASDSFKLGAYRADPSGPAKGGVVVIQEIFGVNHHIRAVCDRLAGEGYAALAPALFDRQQPNFETGYSPDEIAHARKFVANPDWGAMMRDTQAAIDAAKQDGPVGIIGFCMGGTIAFLAAARLNGLSAAIAYYGGQIAKNADEKPKVPTQLHFGEKDASIPMSDVEIIKEKRGRDCEIYVYPDAGHGFNCDERGSYNEAAAKVAWRRSIAFLQTNLKK